LSYIRCCKQSAVFAEGNLGDRGAQHCSASPKKPILENARYVHSMEC
jgi:hypothetical protein